MEALKQHERLNTNIKQVLNARFKFDRIKSRYTNAGINRSMRNHSNIKSQATLPESTAMNSSRYLRSTLDNLK